MAKNSIRPIMTMAQVWEAMEKRYPKREYALLAEVRNSTGYGSRVRTADAIALSLWPSRGLVLHGFEMKQYRNDWKREKERPEKAEEIARFCDYWWLVVTDPTIAPLDEVPAAWGVLGPNKTATVLEPYRQPEKLEPLPLSKSFIAAVLRNQSDSTVPLASVSTKVATAELAGFERGRASMVETQDLERLKKMETRVRAFETALGMNIGDPWGQTPEQLGTLCRAIMAGEKSVPELRRRLESLQVTAAGVSAAIANVLAPLAASE